MLSKVLRRLASSRRALVSRVRSAAQTIAIATDAAVAIGLRDLRGGP
jgi:hypothetical protein